MSDETTVLECVKRVVFNCLNKLFLHSMNSISQLVFVDILRPLDDSVLKSPMATPVATPSPPHSVTSLRTPEVSEQEKVKSEEKSLVETPEITESTQDKTPTESLKELEDDLKE